MPGVTCITIERDENLQLRLIADGTATTTGELGSHHRERAQIPLGAFLPSPFAEQPTTHRSTSTTTGQSWKRYWPISFRRIWPGATNWVSEMRCGAIGLQRSRRRQWT